MTIEPSGHRITRLPVFSGLDLTRLPSVTNRYRLVAWAIAVLGGLLRLYHFDTLSLWVDEGLTVAYAQYAWATLLGLHGVYDVHPPLYYAVVKAVTYLAPEAYAGRLVSVVAGTLTIGVVYALGSRLAGPRVGLLAALVLALSPLHVWYSQEARQYALTALFVALCYLALIVYLQDGRHTALVAYAVSGLLALYTEQSAFFALAPQVAVLAAAMARQSQRVLSLIVAALATALLYLPWVSRLMSVAAVTSQQGQFALSGDKVGTSFMAVAGPAGNTWYFYAVRLPPWDAWSGLQWLLVGATITVALLGTVGLVRSGFVSAATAIALFAGTIGAAALISLVYPSFVYRTVLYAVLGWALLAGGAVMAQHLPRVTRLLGSAGVALLLATSILTLQTIYGSAFKQGFHSLANDTAVAARFGWPVASYPTLTSVLINAYYPHLLRIPFWQFPQTGTSPPLALRGASPFPLLWLAEIGDTPPSIAAALAADHYQRIASSAYTGPLYLELYARPGARIGPDLAVNGNFSGDQSRAFGWQLPIGSLLEPASRGRVLSISNAQGMDEAAWTSVHAFPDHLYVVSAGVRSTLRNGTAAVILSCIDSTGASLATAPPSGNAPPPNDGRWHTLYIGLLCPSGTAIARIELHNRGVGEVLFRHVHLREAVASEPR